MESVQSIERAAAILALLADGGEAGKRLTDVAAEAGLQKSTAHRILGTLVRTGLVEQNERDGRFFLGFRLFALGAAAANRYDLVEIADDAMLRLAQRTEDTIYLFVRSGTEALCLDRVSGSFPIKTLTLHVGDSRPLGVGAGGLALLAWLPDEEVERVVRINAPRLAEYVRYDAKTLLSLVQESRELGHTFNDGMLVSGMRAVSVPIRGKGGRPVAALSVAAIDSRLEADRRAEVVGWLREEARILEGRLNVAGNGMTEAGLRRLAQDRRS
jgi:DNA-binding IclR family transcriptional regulator